MLIVAEISGQHRQQTGGRAGEDRTRGGREGGTGGKAKGGRSVVGTKPDGKMRSVILCGSAELINI